MAQTDDPEVLKLLADKVQRDHGPVIEFPVSFSYGACGKMFFICQAADLTDQFGIIFFPELYGWGAETGEGSFGAGSRRNVEII